VALEGIPAQEFPAQEGEVERQRGSAACVHWR